jgi:hypothetical protein
LRSSRLVDKGGGCHERPWCGLSVALVVDDGFFIGCSDHNDEEDANGHLFLVVDLLVVCCFVLVLVLVLDERRKQTCRAGHHAQQQLFGSLELRFFTSPRPNPACA